MYYNLSKLSKESQDYIFSFTGTNRSKTPAFSIALACLVSIEMKNDKTDINGTVDYSKMINLPGSLSTINELLRIDYDTVIDYARKFCSYRKWVENERYWLNVIHSDDSAITDFFGISKYFSEADLIVIKSEARNISKDVLMLTRLFKELSIFKDNTNDSTNG